MARPVTILIDGKPLSQVARETGTPRGTLYHRLVNFGEVMPRKRGRRPKVNASDIRAAVTMGLPRSVVARLYGCTRQYLSLLLR